MTKVFIDGSAGTTGLRIHERLSARTRVLAHLLRQRQQRNVRARADALNGADIAFLCLPDAAAREAAGWLQNGHTVLIDTSTAHRTAPGWAYGFPELRGARERICASRRIANPGCHASGFIALAAPLVTCGLLSPKSALSCFSLTGYSGGGKQMIAQYESGAQDALLVAPRMYGLGQAHKHLPEMAMYAGLEMPPVFCPTVAPFYAGMEVMVPLHRAQLSGGLDGIRAAYRDYYSDGLVRFAEAADEDGFLSAAAFAGRDDMQITVTGNEERILLVCRFDNLGKGAPGAATQNMNLLPGLPEDTGPNVPAEAAI